MRHLALLMGCAALLALPAPAAGDSLDVRAFVDGVRHAYGGREALARVKAYRMEGSVFSEMRHEDAPTVRIFARPDRFKSLVEYEGGAEARVVSGDSVWRNSPGGPLEAADGPMRSASLLQAARAGLPWTIAEHAASARLLPGEPVPVPYEIQVDGSPTRLVALEITLQGGLVLRAWADSTGLVRVSQGLMTRGAMATHFETVYDDFHTVSGVTFAYHETNWASGVMTGETRIIRVIVNPELRADEFRPAAPPDSLRRRRNGS